MRFLVPVKRVVDYNVKVRVKSSATEGCPRTRRNCIRCSR